MSNAAFSPAFLATGTHSLYNVNFINTNLTDDCVEVFDVVAASVVLGTTVPVLTFHIPAGNGTTSGQYDKDEAVPWAFSNAISFAAVVANGAQCTASTAPGSGITGNIGAK